MDRRTFLSGCGATAMGVLAGCSSGNGTESSDAGDPSLSDVSGSITGFQGGPRHDGRVDATGPTADLDAVWSAGLESADTGYHIGTPLLVDGTLYLQEGTIADDETATATIRALAATSGDEQWRYSTDGTNAIGGATVEGETVVSAVSGRLVGIDIESGEEKWNREISAQVPPVSANETVYVVTIDIGDSRLLAIDAESGETLWDRSVSVNSGFDIGAPAVDDDTLFFPGSDLLALSTADGSERWRASLEEMPTTAPAVDGSTLYVGTRSNGIAAVSLEDQSASWWTAVENASASGSGPRTTPESPAVAAGTVVATSGWAATGLEAETGEKRWGTEIGVFAPPMVDGSVAYVAGIDELVVLSLEDGSTVGSYETDAQNGGTTPPAVADGVVYASLDGLHALK